MAQRPTLLTQEAKGDCGCPTTKKLGIDCEVAVCGDCPTTFKPVKRKSRKRVCFDFSSCFCGDDCCDGTYSQVRPYKPERRNPRGCPDSEGYIRITDPKFDYDTGKMWFSIDAYDSRLIVGERFLIEIWAELPNRDEISISAYISIGA